MTQQEYEYFDFTVGEYVDHLIDRVVCHFITEEQYQKYTHKLAEWCMVAHERLEVTQE